MDTSENEEFPSSSTQAASSIKYVEHTSGTTIADDIELYLGEEDDLTSSHDSDDTEDDFLTHLIGRAELQVRQVDSKLHFVTRATKKAAECLLNQRVVFIEGKPGDGKTTMALYLLMTFPSEAYVPLIIASPEEWKYVKAGQKYVIFIDNIFGSSSFSESRLEGWRSHFDDMIASVEQGFLHLVMTSRVYISQQCHSRTAHIPLFDLKYRIYLHDELWKLREFEKFEILSNHLRKYELTMYETYQTFAVKCESGLGFPQCCRYFVTSKEAQAKGYHFFKDPEQFVQLEVTKLAEGEKLKYFTLVLVMFQGGTMHETDMSCFGSTSQIYNKFQQVQQACGVPPTTSGDAIRQTAHSLCGVFLTYINGIFEFSHQSVWDAVCFSFGKQYPNMLINSCPVHFLVEHTATEGYAKISKGSCAVIDKAHYPTLIERLLVEFESGDLQKAAGYKGFSDQEFISEFLNQFFKRKDRDTILMKQLPETFLEYKYMLSRALSCGHKLMTEKVFSSGVLECLPEYGMEIKHDALEVSCFVGDLESFQMVTSFGIKPCGECLYKNLWFAMEENISMSIIGTLLNIDLVDSETVQKCLLAAVVNKKKSLKTIIQSLNSRNDKQDLLKKALSSACVNGKYDQYIVLKEAIRFCPSPNELICRAGEGGNHHIISDLIGQGADIEACDVFQRTPFYMACRYNHFEAAKVLFKTGADITVRNSLGETVLHAAAIHGEGVEIFKWLLNEGFDLNLKNDRGQTALHTSAQVGNRKALKLVLDKGADCSAVDEDGNTPLHAAAKSQTFKIDCAKSLLQRGADISARNNNQETVLHVVAEKYGGGKSNILLFFLDNNAEINAVDLKGRTVLHRISGCWKCPDATEVLIERGADLTVKDIIGQTPLHVAASVQDNKETIAVLLENKASLHTRDNDGMTPLHSAARTQNTADMISLLIENGSDVSSKDTHGQTPLHLAAGVPRKGWFRNKLHNESLEVLLDRGADLSATDDLQQTPLHIAAARYDCSANVEHLLKRGASLCQVDKNGRTPLHSAAASGHPDSLRLMIDCHADVTACDLFGNSPLHMAAARMPLPTPSDPIRNSAHIEAMTDSVMFDDFYEGIESPLEIVLKAGAQINARNNDGETPLLVCAKVMPQFTTMYRGGLDAQSDFKACTLDIDWKINFLLQRGADIDLADNDGNSSLHKVCLSPGAFSTEVLRKFISEGAEIEAVDKNGNTALHTACSTVGQSSEEIVKQLLSKGVNVFARDKNEYTPLHKACCVCGKSSEGIVQQLISTGADALATDKDWNTPLHLTCRSEGEYRQEVMQELLQHGASVATCIKNADGKTPIDIARAKELEDLVDLLLNLPEEVVIYQRM